jgi:ABC-2 type transport system permease protein
MAHGDIFSFNRFKAVVLKEFIQMRRDRLTFAMMIGIPIFQLIIFGYAINTDPKHLPTAVLSADYGPFARTILYAMKNSEYFTIRKEVSSEAELDKLIREGKVNFGIIIPVDFSRDLLRGKQPSLVLNVDATDPMGVSNAMAALVVLIQNVLDRDLNGPLDNLKAKSGPVNLIIHRTYNPEGNTQYNVVPGLLGVILTLTMVFITALAITREKERGTMENLLSTPLRPIEVMTGKIVPYILVGYAQACLILIGIRFIFKIPIVGNTLLLYSVALFFIAANLSVGLTFSTIARNQLQAVQMSIFFFLPSILLSGFMFPIRGMPEWAQYLGSILPLTHFLPIVRGILLKGNHFADFQGHFFAIIAFLLVVLMIGLKRYRQTLD